MSNQAKVILSAEDKSAAAFATFTRGLDKMGLSANVFKGNVAGLFAGISVGALASFAKSSIDTVDALNDLKDATGASIENLSALQYLAGSTGVEIGTVGTALVKFNAVLKDADPTKGPGATLKALGLSIEDLKRQDPAEAMRQVAVAFQGITNEGDRARVVQELFGKSVKDVAAFLKDLSDNGTLNARVTTQQAEEAEKFNKQLFKMQAAMDEAGRAVSIGLVTEINDFIDRLNRGEGALRAFFGAAEAGSKKLHDGGIFGGPTLLQDLAKARTELEQLEQATFRLSDQDPRMISARQRVAALQAQAQAAGGGRGFINPANVKPYSSSGDVGGGDGGGSGGRSVGVRSSTSAKDPYAEAKSYLETLQGQLQSAKAMTAAEKLLDDIRRGSVGKLTPELEKQLKTTAAQVDATKALTKAEEERAANQQALDALIADLGKKDGDRLQRLLDATPTEQIEKQRTEMLFLAEAYEQGRLGAVGSADAMARYSEAAQSFLGNLPPAMEELSSSAMNASKRIQETLGDTLVDVLSGDFDSIGDSFAKLIERMLAEAAAAQIMDSLFGKVGVGGQRSSDGFLTTFLASILPSANGNVFPSSPGISAYSSSVVSKPTLFPFAKGVGLMGEAGAEAIMPLRRGADGRLGVSASGASVTLNVINNGAPVQASQSSRTGPDGRQIIDLVLSAVGDGLANRSGPVSRGLESGYGIRPAMA